MSEKIQKKLLRVNLTTGKISIEVIPEDDIKMSVGGRALGDMFLYKEVAPGIDPLSPDNKLFFSAGPLTGTQTPGSSRYIVHTKSPLTGLYLSTLAGGYFGPELRKTGYDVIVVEGKSEKPVYLVVCNDKAELKDATPYWGMTTDDAQDCIKEELGDSKFRIACIGPAGENLVLFAAIISERRACGRGGAGAVMGSKNIKAVAVRGTKEVAVANPKAFREALKRVAKDIEASPTVSKVFPLYGSCGAMPALNEGGIIPWHNWQDSSQPGGVNLFAQTWREKYVRKDVRCAPPCNVKCSKLTVSREGPHAGVMTEGPDYEAEYCFGACCDITDQTAVIEADALCDRYGLDTISMGVTIAFAMECFEKGILTARDTGGDEVKFGRGDLLEKLIRQTAYRSDFGALLSLGSKRLSEKLGKGSEAFAMHAKGLELGGYDPRGAKSSALVFACGSRGGCHKSGGSANFQSCKELTTGDMRFSTEGKAAFTKAVRERRVLADSAVLCVFPEGAYSAETVADLLNSVTGYSWTTADLYAVGERGSNIERAFNVREGLRRSWDTLPRRLLAESVKSGPTKGQVVELDILLDDFYKLCGWDIKSGIPFPEKLKELGLDKIAEEMAGYLKKGG